MQHNQIFRWRRSETYSTHEGCSGVAGFRLAHKFPDQQGGEQSRSAGNKKCRAPSPMRSHLGRQYGSRGQTDQSSSTDDQADVSSAPVCRRRFLNQRRHDRPGWTSRQAHQGPYQQKLVITVRESRQARQNRKDKHGRNQHGLAAESIGKRAEHEGGCGPSDGHGGRQRSDLPMPQVELWGEVRRQIHLRHAAQKDYAPREK